MSWFEDDGFWTDLYPFLFPPERIEAAGGEVDNILELIGKRPRRVLDLCCGPGRHAIAMAKKGVEVTAVDRTASYLETAKNNAREAGVEVSWVHGDMRSFQRPGEFDLVLNLFTSFGYLENDEQEIELLKRMAANIAPGGHLLMEMVSKEWLAANFTETTSTRLHDGSIVVQRLSVVDDWHRVENEWIILRGGKSRTFHFTHTVFTGVELRTMLQAAGLHDVKLYGGFDGGAYGRDSERLVALARR